MLLMKRSGLYAHSDWTLGRAARTRFHCQTNVPRWLRAIASYCWFLKARCLGVCARSPEFVNRTLGFGLAKYLASRKSPAYPGMRAYRKCFGGYYESVG